MKDQRISNNFEQMRSPRLSLEVRKIVADTARDIKRSNKNRALEPKHLEAAYALLYMRLFQRLGAPAKAISEQAFHELETVLSDDTPPLIAAVIRPILAGVVDRFRKIRNQPLG